MINPFLGEGPLVVERKGSAIYTSCAEVPTKMLCPAVATLNMSLPSNIMFCGLFLTIWKQILINSWGYLLCDFIQLPLRIGPQTYMYYPLKVEGIMRPNLILLIVAYFRQMNMLGQSVDNTPTIEVYCYRSMLFCVIVRGIIEIGF